MGSIGAQFLIAHKIALCYGFTGRFCIACGEKENKHIDFRIQRLETALLDFIKTTTSNKAGTSGKNQFKDHGKNREKHFNLPFFISSITI